MGSVLMSWHWACNDDAGAGAQGGFVLVILLALVSYFACLLLLGFACAFSLVLPMYEAGCRYRYISSLF